MRRILTGLFSLLGFTAVMLISPAWAACVGAGCGCTALAVPAWSAPPGTSVTDKAYVTPPGMAPWYIAPTPDMTPEEYVADCSSNISSCLSSSVVVGTDAPPGNISSWNAFNTLTPPSGYRTSSGCYGYGTGPCNAKVSSATSLNAYPGVTNYNYSTAFPCEMSSGGTPLGNSDAGAVKQFRMKPNESISFSFTVPPVGVLNPTTTDSAGNLIMPIYRSISFNDWNNPFGMNTVKFVTISKTSGDFDTAKAAAGDPCYKSGVMGEIPYLVVDATNSGFIPPNICPLQAGQTYYINVRFEDPKDYMLTQGGTTGGNTSTIDAAKKNLQTALNNLYTGLGVSTPVPNSIAIAEDQLVAAIMNTSGVSSAQATLDAAIASGDANQIAQAQAAYDAAKSSYDAAVQIAQDNLNKKLAAAGATPTVNSTQLATLRQAVTNAINAYEAAMAPVKLTNTFVQDTCEWSLCNNDQMHSNVGTPMDNTYTNAYRKEWQCTHDMVAYYTDPSVKSFCQMVQSGQGPEGCSFAAIDLGIICYPYSPVNPADCVGNRYVASSFQSCTDILDPNTCTTNYTYGYTGGTPINDCGVSLDMGCGISVQ